ncbi:MAG: hypothetical protein V7L20_05860 [Nostoc sp.]
MFKRYGNCDRSSINCVVYRRRHRQQKLCLHTNIHQQAALHLRTPQLTGAAT